MCTEYLLRRAGAPQAPARPGTTAGSRQTSACTPVPRQAHHRTPRAPDQRSEPCAAASTTGPTRACASQQEPGPSSTEYLLDHAGAPRHRRGQEPRRAPGRAAPGTPCRGEHHRSTRPCASQQKTGPTSTEYPLHHAGAPPNTSDPAPRRATAGTRPTSARHPVPRWAPPVHTPLRVAAGNRADQHRIPATPRRCATGTRNPSTGIAGPTTV